MPGGHEQWREREEKEIRKLQRREGEARRRGQGKRRAQTQVAQKLDDESRLGLVQTDCALLDGGDRSKDRQARLHKERIINKIKLILNIRRRGTRTLRSTLHLGKISEVSV